MKSNTTGERIQGSEENRILVISPRYWPERVRINDICQGFSKRGYGVDVVCGQPNYPEGRFFDGYHSTGHREERHRGVRILRHFEIRRGNAGGFRIMMNYLSVALGAAGKVRRLKKRKYDAVLIWQTSPVMSCRAGLKAGRKRGIPVVTCVADLWPFCFYREMDMQSPLLRWIFRRVSEKNYRASDLVAVRNERTREHFVKELNIHPGRVKLIPPGPDSVLHKGTDNRTIIERYYGSFNIVCYDPYLERQDYDTLLEAAVRIRNTGIINLKVIIVCHGKGNSLKKKVSKKNVTDIIYVEEDREFNEPAAYFMAADAFMSFEKTSAGDEYYFPEDIADYMSFGKPVIFAGDGEGRRMVREAGCGLVGDPEDPEGLAAMILEMYKTPKEKLESLGEAALSYQKENLSRVKCIDELLDLMFRDPGDGDEFMISSSASFIRADDLIEDETEGGQ